MRRTLGVAGLSIALLSGLVAVPMNASADSGDGKLACNAGEICLSRDWPATRYQKHFWNGGSHDGYSWVNTQTGGATYTKVQNSASSVKNRDSRCYMKIVNDRGPLPDNYKVIANDSTWRYVGDQMNDANDRHERC